MMSNRPDPTTLPPAAVRIIARQPDGSEADVTEGVQELWETLLDTEDACVPGAVYWPPVAVLAKACDLRGWQGIDEDLAREAAWRAEQGARKAELRAESDAKSSISIRHFGDLTPPPT